MIRRGLGLGLALGLLASPAVAAPAAGPSISVVAPDARRGEASAVRLTIELPDGSFLLADEADGAALTWTIEPAPPLTFGTVHVPSPTPRGERAVHAGKVTLSVPVTAAADAPLRPVKVPTTLRWQLCTDSGCASPQTQSLAITIKVLRSTKKDTPTQGTPPAQGALPAETTPLARIAGEALTSDVGWERLVHLCDRIGHRISGSPQLELAIAWAQERLREDGLRDVRVEPVLVPRWIRGGASLSLVSPRPMALDVLALGGSIGTPPGGIEADVLVVDSLADLAQRDDAAVAGRIVVIDQPFTTYRETVPIRTRGAAAASRKGAVAVLVRSVGPHGHQTPHTGNQSYEADTPPIPAAAITLEAAELLRRLQERGATSRLALDLGCSSAEPAPSANVVGEVRGREHPEEIVLVGCHLDSWDVGQGAQDDGAGCVAAMEAARLIARLPTPPLRTVRVVLFTNEENGLAGAHAYAAAHGDEPHFAVMESDTGAGTPLGFRVDLRVVDESGDVVRDEASWTAVRQRLAPLAAALGPLAASDLSPGYGGADISPMVKLGAPGFGLSQDMSGYWPIHHTEADTIDKIDPVTFRQNVAVFASAAWVLANMEQPLRP